METTLTTYTVAQICDGFTYNELEGKGLFGLGGRLTIQPEYQRNYIYAESRRDAGVVDSLLRGHPLGLFYFNELGDGSLEVLDGQQRITSFGRYLAGKFAVTDGDGMQQYFSGLAADQQEQLTSSEILVYHCRGAETEIKQWFKTINTAGIALNEQELRNAVYSGPFVSAGKAVFSNSQNANTQKWRVYVRGAVNRQDLWERALEWVSGGDVDGYMSRHRNDATVDDVLTYFTAVIDWASSVFTSVRREMCGLEWARLYEEHHATAYNPAAVDAEVQRLYDDPYVRDPRGIFEYVLGGCSDDRLLDVRVFDEATKRATYGAQTAAAKKAKVSNCPLCAQSGGAAGTKLWSQGEMEADHVTAWSKGGATTAANCQLLCVTHNRSKGNR